MTSFAPLERSGEREFLDGDAHSPRLLKENLADLARLNRWLGGSRLTLRAIDRLVAPSPGSALAILDVGAGGMDIPHALARAYSRRGVRASIVASDRSLRILALAGRDAHPLAAADARALPFRDRSFDVATCSLVLHHLDPPEAVAMLREMARVSRRGVVVNDLVRGRLPYVGAWLLARVCSRNPLTRHDAPLSVRRAYTPAEMRALAARAGLGPPAFEGFLGYRLAMTIASSR